jgi:ribonuclease-3
LGDAVLGLVVGARLFIDFPDRSEGELTKLRAVLVRGNTLARVARRLGLGRLLYLGKGEDATDGRRKSANLAGAMEAIIGAVYLDQGLEVAEGFVLRLLTPELESALKNGSQENYKSELQEIFQARDQRAPTYHVVSATGPDHDRRFTVEVRLGDTVLGSGSGRSKKSAETDAAQVILERILANVAE